jgi:hypothetical protein
VLLDSRFLVDENVAQLSRWTHGHVRRGLPLVDVAESLKQFFQGLALDPPRSSAPQGPAPVAASQLTAAAAAAAAAASPRAAGPVVSVPSDDAAARAWLASSGIAQLATSAASLRDIANSASASAAGVNRAACDEEGPVLDPAALLSLSGKRGRALASRHPRDDAELESLLVPSPNDSKRSAVVSHEQRASRSRRRTGRGDSAGSGAPARHAPSPVPVQAQQTLNHFIVR